MHAAARGTRFEALEPIRQAVSTSFGRHDAGVAAGVALCHDHGSVYRSATFREELAFLDIAGSPAYVRETEGNGRAGRFVRTLQKNLLWVESFATLAEVRRALIAFKRRSNQAWLIERHGFRSPAQVRADLATPRRQAA